MAPGATTSGVTIGGDGLRAYVGLPSPNAVAVLEPTTNSLVTTIPVSTAPVEVAG